MLQLVIELFTARPSWGAARADEKRKAVGAIAAATRNLDPSIEFLGACWNDQTTPSPYDCALVFRAPQAELRDAIRGSIAASGWTDHFIWVSVGGDAVTPAALQVPSPAQRRQPIPSSSRYAKKKVKVNGIDMAYVEAGAGCPIVFVHGDVMSSHLWRNVIPYVEDMGRCLAIDLIGAGDSDKIPDSRNGSYSYFSHLRYLTEALVKLGVDKDVVLVGHDWGANLLMDWAVAHPEAAYALAFSEAVLPPFEWTDWPEGAAPLFRKFRTPEGERAILEHNVFVEALQAGMMRMVPAELMSEVRRPYAQPGEARRPTVDWPRAVPLGGEPADVHRAIVNMAEVLRHSELPKLFINSEPGAIMNGRRGELVRTWSNLTEVTVFGGHWPPEDDPHRFGAELRRWLFALKTISG